MPNKPSDLNRYHAALKDIERLEAELAEARKDTALLDDLEKLIEATPGGLLIHRQTDHVMWSGFGLGLAQRSLRKAISQAAE